MRYLWILFLLILVSCEFNGGSGNGEPYPGAYPSDHTSSDGDPRYGFITREFIEEYGATLEFHSYSGSKSCDDGHGLIYFKLDFLTMEPELLYRVDDKCREERENLLVSDLKFPGPSTEKWWFFFHRDQFYHFSPSGQPRNDFEVAHCYRDLKKDDINLDLKIVYDRNEEYYRYYALKSYPGNQLEFSGVINSKKLREGERVFEQQGIKLTIKDIIVDGYWKGELEFDDLDLSEFQLKCLIDSKHKP